MKSSGNSLSHNLRMRSENERSQPSSKPIETLSLPTVSQPHFSKTQIASENAIRKMNVGSRLSGTLSYTTGNVGLADRTQTIRPSSCCVRCSLHASICMDCCDLQTHKAVAFYRTTLGKGASAILSQAISEAGLGIMSKTIIFNLWKNGTLIRNQARDKRMVEVSLQSDQKMMKTPFVAWRKYTKDELFSKKIAIINELETKMIYFQKQNDVLSDEKIRYKAQVCNLLILFFYTDIYDI